jgi:hypothetical protein
MKNDDFSLRQVDKDFSKVVFAIIKLGTSLKKLEQEQGIIV